MVWLVGQMAMSRAALQRRAKWDRCLSIFDQMKVVEFEWVAVRLMSLGLAWTEVPLQKP